MHEADDPRMKAAFLDRIGEDRQNIRQAMASCGLKKLETEGGADADNHVLAVNTLRGFSQIGVVNVSDFFIFAQRFRPQHFLLVQHVANAHDFTATLR